MESIEKLRELNTFGSVKIDGDLVATDMLMVCATKEKINEIADEIEREIAEKYMLLPVDADGAPIRCGDKIHRTTSAVDNVVKVIGVSEREFFFNGPNFMEPGIKKNVCNAVRHAPRTLEDVLTDFANEVARQGHQIGLTGHELTMRYAAEIRELMEVDG